MLARGSDRFVVHVGADITRELLTECLVEFCEYLVASSVLGGKEWFIRGDGTLQGCLGGEMKEKIWLVVGLVAPAGAIPTVIFSVVIGCGPRAESS